MPGRPIRPARGPACACLPQAGQASPPAAGRRRVARPDGASLHVEEHGPAAGAAPTLLMTHGWDLDATAWYYEKKRLADRFRLVLWDLPGLGLSTQPKDGRYSMEGMARDLRAVLDATAGAGPWCWSATASAA
jgi:pimeloyl-ACP methyl ester carboxylesterase